MDKKMKSTVEDSNPEPSTDIWTIDADIIHAIIKQQILSSLRSPEFRTPRGDSIVHVNRNPDWWRTGLGLGGSHSSSSSSSSSPLQFRTPLEDSIGNVNRKTGWWRTGLVRGGSYSSSSSSFSSLSSNLNNASTTAFPRTAGPTPRPETESFILNNSSEIQLWSEPPNEMLSDAQAIDDPNIYPAGDVAIDINHILQVLNLDQKKSAIIQEDSRKFLKLREIFLALTGQAAISLMAYAQPMEASTSSSSSPPPPPNARLYILVATNAIAFVLCFISFLLQNRKPVVAKIMEAIGSVVAAVAFFFMMAMFLPV